MSKPEPDLLTALSVSPQQVDPATLETRSRKKLIDKRAHSVGLHFSLHRGHNVLRIYGLEKH